MFAPLTPLLILLLAATWDYLLGDPVTWLHPVQVMGWLIGYYCQFVFWLGMLGQPTGQSTTQVNAHLARLAGVGLSIVLVGGSGLVGWGAVQGSTWLHPGLGALTGVVGLASCLAGRGLRDAAIDVLTPLTAGDLPRARHRLARYVGRDTEQLSAVEVLRALLETVSENATDGVFAPLFYALLGLGLGGVPLSLGLALAYKAASTLDSCVGYKRAPYTHLGWFPARSEDVLTWLPCRLAVISLALVSGQPRRVWQICRRDGPQDPSPNSGWSMAAYAAILGVQLGGMNFYQGEPRPKPCLGDALRPIQPAQIWQALGLTRRVCYVWFALAGVVAGQQSQIWSLQRIIWGQLLQMVDRP